MNSFKEKRTKLFLDNLKSKKGDEFELLGEYTRIRDKTTFKHNICGYVWETTPNLVLNSKKGKGCPYCQYRAKSKTTQEFSKEVFTKTKGEYSLSEGQEYHNNRHKLKFKHNTCGNEFILTPTSIFREQTSCPKCYKEKPNPKLRDTEWFVNELLKVHKGQYTLVNGSKYTGALNKVNIKHEKCGYEWNVRAYHILNSSGCPNCNESKGELLIKGELNNKGIDFKREYAFEDCRNNKELPFDFAILYNNELKGLIEYDGSQHYIAYSHFGGEEKLRKTQYNDMKKNKYCEDNNIPLLRIKYDLSNKEKIEVLYNFLKNIKVMK